MRYRTEFPTGKPSRYWSGRKIWCVTINGKRINLGRYKKDAVRDFHASWPKSTGPQAASEFAELIGLFPH